MSLVTRIVPALSRVEEGFHFEASKQWATDYWVTSLPISAIYLVVIFTIKSVMATRQPFSLRRLLTMWNVGLALFSFIGVVTCVPELVSRLATHGLEYGNCNIDGVTTKTIRLWMFLFALSKLFELGDTLFIVLRKTPLIFLHYYHHITVLMYCWYSWGACHEIGFWFGGLNYIIHTIMYSYYALKAMRVRVPSAIAQSVTMLQILQMCAGIVLNLLSLLVDNERYGCEVPYGSSYSGLAMYISYLLLFLRFFYNRFIGNKQKTA